MWHYYRMFNHFQSDYYIKTKHPTLNINTARTTIKNGSSVLICKQSGSMFIQQVDINEYLKYYYDTVPAEEFDYTINSIKEHLNI